MKTKITAILLCVLMLALPVVTNAASSASLSFSGDTEAVCGETFTVALLFSASEKISTLQAEFTYDSEKIEFVSDSNIVHAADGTGSISDSFPEEESTYYLTFRALALGKTSLNISEVELISEQTGKRIGNPSGSVEIEITEKVQDAPNVSPQPTDSEEVGIADKNIESEKTLTINNKKYILLDREVADGYRLLGDADGKLLIWEQSSGSLTEFKSIAQNLLYFFPEQPILENYTTQNVIFLDGVDRELYRADAEDIYYVYLQNASGVCAWYRYDAQEKTLQKVFVETTVMERSVRNERSEFWNVVSWILFAGIVLSAVILIAMLVRRKKV